MLRAGFRPIHLAMGLSVLVSHATAATLQQQAADLRAKAIANIAALSTLDVETRTTNRMMAGATQAPEQRTTDRVKWHKSKQQLKWTRVDGSPQAYVADGTARTLLLMNGATTTFDDSLTAAEAAELSRPKPAWIWQPDWFLPTNPAGVREDGAALVLTTASAHPRREIWLDTSSGCLLKFTDTDATGRQTRLVEVRDWRKSGAVWLPGSATERVTGATGGFERVIEFVSATANPQFTEGSFALP